jgi:hypothetical protein
MAGTARARRRLEFRSAVEVIARSRGGFGLSYLTAGDIESSYRDQRTAFARR